MKYNCVLDFWNRFYQQPEEFTVPVVEFLIELGKEACCTRMLDLLRLSLKNKDQVVNRGQFQMLELALTDILAKRDSEESLPEVDKVYHPYGEVRDLMQVAIYLNSL